MTDQELIEAVGKEILGWKLVIMPPGTMWIDQQGENIEYGEPRGLGTYFNPLSNPNHWMMIVKKMNKNNWSFEMTMRHNGGNRAEFYNLETNKSHWYDFDNKSIGHVICLASLEAVRSLK
jgi:hypothetical protein